MIHTVFTWTSIWQSLIVFFGKPELSDFIPTSLSLTVAFTSILTFSVHCFYAHRLHLRELSLSSNVGPLIDSFDPSKQKKLVSHIIDYPAFDGSGSAFATSAEMVHIHSFRSLRVKFWWLFSMGLAISSVIDILILFSFFVLLQRKRSDSLTLDRILDSLILYAFEIGFLTCAGSIISMICWLTMDDNLIFMGIHLVIGKRAWFPSGQRALVENDRFLVYANSMLATLNTRYSLRESQMPLMVSRQSDIPGSRWRQSYYRNSTSSIPYGGSPKITPVRIEIERSVQFSYDGRNENHGDIHP
ncbi:hypothetical protein BDZ94DRAFT_1309869 [Collybia nuda]|uniref:DUF6534 domain-containing protein n=1 Tax=Collybia nuda TaxID=64659 RepID=A0A9P5Y4S8_9AGAR|nr:hypothetical protein BDZ94DRAFT_1309869 [Collybia nuda]